MWLCSFRNLRCVCACVRVCGRERERAHVCECERAGAAGEVNRKSHTDEAEEKHHREKLNVYKKMFLSSFLSFVWISSGSASTLPHREFHHMLFSHRFRVFTVIYKYIYSTIAFGSVIIILFLKTFTVTTEISTSTVHNIINIH